MEFKEVLKQQRIAHGFTQEELGEMVGLQKAAIYKYENGLLVNPKRSLIQKLAEIFDVSPAYMMGIEDGETQTYFDDPETIKMVQFLHDNPQYKVMFDSTRDLDPKSVKEIIEFIKFKRQQEGLDD